MSLLPNAPDAGVRAVDHFDGDDIAQLDLMESEAREALDGARGAQRWMVEHPEIGERWAQRCTESGADVVVAHIGAVVVGYLVADLGDDHIVRIDQVWVTPAARENGFGPQHNVFSLSST